MSWERIVGPNYMTDAPDEAESIKEAGRGRRSPVNLSMQQFRTLVSSLAFRAGDCDVIPQRAGLELEGEIRATGLEVEGERLRLTDKLQEVVGEAIACGIGLMKVGQNVGQNVIQFQGTEIDPGELYVEPADFDDYTVDATAKNLRRKLFDGLRTTIDRADAIESKLYGLGEGEVPLNPKVATQAEAEDMLRRMDSVNRKDRQNQTSGLSDQGAQSGEDDDDTLSERVYVWTLYVRCSDGLFEVTLPGKSSGGSGTGDQFEVADKFLSVRPYNGPEEGPLEMLAFLPVGANIMPLSLEQMQADMAMAADQLMRKIIRQILARKTNHVARPGDGEKTVKRLEDAPDGKSIVGDPDSLTQFDSGGVPPETVAAMPFIQAQWDNVTANMTLAGGGSPQGSGGNKTATAYMGQSERVQSFLEFLRSRVEAFTTRIYRRMAMHWDADPRSSKILPFRVGADTYDVPWSEDLKEGRWSDFTYRVRAYSMAPVDPAVEAANLMTFIGQSLPAIAQAAAAGEIDGPAAMRLVARKMRWQEVDQLLPDPVLQAQRQMMAAMGPVDPRAMGGMPGMPGPMGAPGASMPGANPAAMPSPQSFATPLDASRSARSPRFAAGGVPQGV